jgi:hypothetical protein
VLEALLRSGAEIKIQIIEKTGTQSKESAPHPTSTRLSLCGTTWKVDYKTRKRDGEVSLPNSQAVPLIHPEGKKLYCGGQWHALSVYDVDIRRR